MSAQPITSNGTVADRRGQEALVFDNYAQAFHTLRRLGPMTDWPVCLGVRLASGSTPMVVVSGGHGTHGDWSRSEDLLPPRGGIIVGDRDIIDAAQRMSAGRGRRVDLGNAGCPSAGGSPDQRAIAI